MPNDGSHNPQAGGFSLSAIAAGVSEVPWPIQPGGEIVHFDFSNGDTLSTPSVNNIGFTFNNLSFPMTTTPGGKDGVRFRFGPDLADQDSSSELRFELNSNHFETYDAITLFVPANFTHRSLLTQVTADDISTWQIGDVVETYDSSNWGTIYSISGGTFYLLNAGYMISQGWDTTHVVRNTTRTEEVTLTGSSSSGINNKFSHMWEGDYPTNGMDLEYNSDDVTSGTYPGSYFTLKATATDSTPQTSNFVSEISVPYGLQEGSGSEIVYTVRRRRSSSLVASDGLVEVWKDTVLVYRKTGINFFDSVNNFFTKGYIMGWANSGFEEITDFVMTDYKFYGDTRPSGLQA